MTSQIAKHHLFLIFITTLLLSNCASDPTTSTPPLSNTTSSKNSNLPPSAILIFKEEQQLEIWKNGKLQQSTNINLDSKYPVGIFGAQPIDPEIDKGFQIEFPNEFYNRKEYSLKFDRAILTPKLDLKDIDFSNMAIYVFPNDARKGQSFVANFSSPHWMAELYAKMNLYLLEYD